MKRRREEGFALLLVFVLAAGIAIFLLTQIPRVCFETQRDREEMLIERGEQYQRAIGLYIRKFNRYPAKIEDLENTNNIRFLRRRYIDPMTGKDDWRFIHAGPGGQLTDSLVQKAGAGVGPDGKPVGSTPDGMRQASGMNVDPGNATGNPNDPNQPPEVNAAVRARPSDRPIGQPGGQQPGMAQPGQPGYDPSQAGNQAYNPNYNPYYGYSAAPPPAPGATTYQQYQQYPQGAQPQPQPGQPPLQPGQPPFVQQPGFVQPTQNPGQQGYTQQGYPQPGYPQPGQAYPQAPAQTPFAQPGASNQPGMQPYPQNPAGFQSAPGAFNPQPFPQQPGAFLPGQGGAQQAQAAQMIQQILTQPRPMPANLAGAVTQNAPGAGGFGGPGPAPSGAPGSFNSPGGFSNSSSFNNPSTFNNPSNPGAPSSFGGGAQAGGGGIAGVATKYKGPSIKVYADRQKYQEWEFVYDPRKEAQKQAQAAGLAGQQPGGLGGQQPGGLGGQQGGLGGQTGGFGQGSGSMGGQMPGGFGQSGVTQPAPPSSFGQPGVRPPGN